MEWIERFPEHEDVIGPIQRSEAVAIYGLIRTLRPRNLVELGFYRGDSCSMLCAASADYGGRVTSYDITPVNGEALELMQRYPGTLEVRQCDQRLVAETIEKERGPIDFLFIDASHDFETNRETWASLEGLLAPEALVVVHDTGLWTVRGPNYQYWGTPGQVRWDMGEGRPPMPLDAVQGMYHQPHEVAFVNWVVETCPHWVKMDFMSVHTFRHGFTLLQRRRKDFQ
jgi:hypothetical protein